LSSAGSSTAKRIWICCFCSPTTGEGNRWLEKHDSSPCASQSTATSLHTETFANTLLGFTTDKKIRQKKKKKKKLCAATTQHTTLVIWSTAALYLV
jgi:hypothetical protein